MFSTQVVTITTQFLTVMMTMTMTMIPCKSCHACLLRGYLDQIPLDPGMTHTNPILKMWEYCFGNFVWDSLLCDYFLHVWRTGLLEQWYHNHITTGCKVISSRRFKVFKMCPLWSHTGLWTASMATWRYEKMESVLGSWAPTMKWVCRILLMSLW